MEETIESCNNSSTCQPAVFIASQKGSRKLTHDGYVYVKNRSHETLNGDTKTYWRCELCRRDDSMKCTGKAHTIRIGENEYLIDLPEQHNHSPQASRVPVAHVRQFLKDQGKNSFEDPVKVVQIASVCHAESHIRQYLPSHDAMKQVVKRARKESLPSEPLTLDDINIPLEYQFVNCERFLVADSHLGNDRILVFTTRTNVEKLSKARFWIMDGTFKTVPTLFRQLYSIHAPVGDTNNTVIMPLVYCLMTSKTEECYVEMFKQVKEFALEEQGTILDPKFLITDFEKAAINASSSVFRSTTNKGCLFHLGQSIWRRIQSDGLAKDYGNDEDFSLKMRFLLSLAFLKTEEIPAAFDEIKLHIPDKAKSVLDWFDEYYVNGPIRNSRNSVPVRSPPLFPPSLWNVEDTMKEGIPRTQNKVEAWHRRWNILVGKAHVGVYRLVKEIHMEQQQTITAMQNIIAGIPAPHPRKKFADKEKRIKRIIDSRAGNNPREIMDFIKGIAYNMSL